MRPLSRCLATLALVTTAACGSGYHAAMSPMKEASGGAPAPAAAPGMADGAEGMPPPAPPADMRLAENTPVTTERGPDAPPGKDAQVSERVGPILIYTADFTLAVFEAAAGLKSVEDLARELGGFVVRRDDRAATIRVPASRFQEAVGRIEKMGDVTRRNVVAQDVTEEFLDLGVRLKNARAVRDRLEQLLSKATTVQDSLVIERELGRVAAEIERLEGRMKFLRDRAAFSTITVTFDAKPSEEVGSPSFRLPFPWLGNLGLGRLMNL